MIDVSFKPKESLSFTKIYSQTGSVVQYTFVFVPEGNLYIGQYTTPGIPQGSARCFVRELSEDFMIPPDLSKLTQFLKSGPPEGEFKQA